MFGKKIDLNALELGTRLYLHESGKDARIVEHEGNKSLEILGGDINKIEDGETMIVDVLSCNCGT